MKVRGFRRFLGLFGCLIAAIVLALLKAPGEAYTALGMLGMSYFGAAGIEQWSASKKPSEKIEKKVEFKGE